MVSRPPAVLPGVVVRGGEIHHQGEDSFCMILGSIMCGVKQKLIINNAYQNIY